jgi:predicted RecB family nuclease
MQKTHRLSKSRLMDFLQCPKKLYLRTYHPDLAKNNLSTIQSFNAGNEVGELARTIYADGILIGHDDNLSLALSQTRNVLRENPDKPIFEATFEHSGVLVRADVLLPYRDGYHMIEVKSSTSVKQQYLPDCAVQTWVIRGAGVNLLETSLSHIDNSFVYDGKGDYKGLFKQESITDSISPMVAKVRTWVNSAIKVLDNPLPEIAVGDQCFSPYECPFIEQCAPNRDRGYPVTILPRITKKQVDQFKEVGISDIRQIPEGELTNPSHLQVWRATVSGKPELNPNIGAILKKYPYPRFYLDFETIGFAVPIWKDTRPFQQLPFQWSCHIERSEIQLDHKKSLNTSGDDPSWDFIKTVLSAVEESGPIFVYSSYEKTILTALAERFLGLEARISDVIARLVDLYPLTVKNYYHPQMRGSWSIKSVLPTISGLNYKDVGEVQDGVMAQQAYLELISKDTPSNRRESLKHDLLEYCKLDTQAMVELEHFLESGDVSECNPPEEQPMIEEELTVAIPLETVSKIEAKVLPVENERLVIAVSSRALFDLDESHAIFEKDGIEAYCKYQIENEDTPLNPGVAFNLVKKLLSLNLRDPDHPRVEVILISRNSADTGLRIFNSISHHGLDICRAAFTRGESTHAYIASFGTHLFLSAEPEDVRMALEAGFAAATILPSQTATAISNPSQLRIAFDGDAVIFSDESERIFKQQGLEAFVSNESKESKLPLLGGPFKSFLSMLHRIQLDYPADSSPIRTALITARGAPAHERVIRTLRVWNIRIDEALFLGGMDKGEFLKAFSADIFFDDQRKHCDSARQHVATGHVPSGVANE